MYFNLNGSLQHANLEWNLFLHFHFQGPQSSIKLSLCLYKRSYFVSTKHFRYNVKGQVHKAFLIAFQKGWFSFGGGKRGKDGT